MHYPPPASWITAGELNELLDRYDHATVEPFDSRHPLQGQLIASDLPRARDTASLLFGVSAPSIETRALFREVPLPRFRNTARRLPAGALLAVSRLGWYFGWMESEEPRNATLRRVDTAATALIEASRADEITLVSHGFFLLLLGKELRARGYSSSKRGLYSHLERATFHPG